MSARLHSRYAKLTIIMLYTPTIKAKESVKEERYKSVIFSKTRLWMIFKPSLRQLCQVRDPKVVFPKLSLMAVLLKMGHGVNSLLW